MLLGRLLPDYFPKIFGPSEKEPLDIDASRAAFEKVVKEVNDSYGSAEGDANAKKEWLFDEVVYGLVYVAFKIILFEIDRFLVRFIKVANETMCRPIRALTEARGYATGQHVYALGFLFSFSATDYSETDLHPSVAQAVNTHVKSPNYLGYVPS